MSAVYDRVGERYQRITRENEQKRAQNRKTAYQKAPELEALENEILALNLDKLKSAIISGESDAIDKKIKTAEKKIKTLLKDNGFKLNFLDPIYTCESCQDTGYISPLKKCDCFHRYLLEERVKESGLNANSGMFEAFDETLFKDKTQQKYMSELKKRAENFVAQHPTGELKTFLIMGNTGTGKTFLAEAILNKLLLKGQIGLYMTAGKLFSAFHKHRLGEPVDIDIYNDVPALVIDDLGTEMMTRNVTQEYFYNLVNERSLNGNATIIATNLDPAMIKERYGDRTYSRLFSKQAEKHLIPAEFTDIRKQK